MREIKFRGKRLDNGEWVYGYFARFAHGEIPVILADSVCSLVDYKVIPDTVGQFTGLLDKNGKEIYEGDVVVRECRYDGTCRLPSYSFLKFGKVRFQQCNCRFVMSFSDVNLTSAIIMQRMSRSSATSTTTRIVEAK